VTELPVHRFDRQLVEHVRDYTGRVEHVYPEIAVIVPADRGPLLAFLHSGRALVPCGIEVPWETVRPRPGLFVTKQGRSIRVGDRSPVFLGLAGDGQSLRPDAPGTDWGAGILKERLAALRLPYRTRALLGRGECESCLEGRMIAAAGTELRRLVGCLRDGATGSEPYRDIVGKLAGLGPGSTPTGDDLLLGVCALAWRLCSAGLLSPESLDGFRTCLDELPPDATTRTGREILAQAVRGAFLETLLRFIDALGDKTADDRSVAMEAGRLGRIGGRSGCDMLAGVVSLAGAYAKGAQT
jgi:hypothetical protein